MMRAPWRRSMDDLSSLRGDGILLSTVTGGSPCGGTIVRAWTQSRPLTALGLAVLGTGGACIGQDVLRLSRVAPDRRINAYKAPQYWLDYRDGFVRRALPGAVLSALVGGVTTRRQVTMIGVGLSLTATAAVVPLAVQAARLAPDDVSSLLVGGTVVSSPLSVSLLLHDIGRFDAVGVLALAALASPASRWERMPCAAGAPVLAGVLAVTAATQEFMVAPLAPLVLMRAGALAVRCGLDPARTALLLTSVLAPGAGITIASAVMTPPAAAAQSARRRARAQGVGSPDEMGDALSAVERDIITNRGFFHHFAPSAIVRGLLMWVGVFVLTAVVLSQLLGLVSSRRYWWQVAYQATVGAVLSMLGADFRRWWGLSLLSLVAGIGAAPALQDRMPVPSPHRAAALRFTASAVVGLAMVNLRVRHRVVAPARRTDAAPGQS